MSTDYLKRILTSRSTTSPSNRRWSRPLLSQRLSNTVLLKREDTQAVFSFKLRGAYNKMANLPPAARNRGVIAASAGTTRRGAGGHAAGLPRGHRHAHHQPAGEGGRGAPPGRRGGAGRREFLRCLRPRAGAGKEGKADLRASVRRSRRDRRPGYGGNGDPAPASGSDRRHLRGHRRRRADLGRGRHQAAAPEIKIIGVQTEDSDAMLRSVRAAGACS